VSPARYEQVFYIPEDGILHSQCREFLTPLSAKVCTKIPQPVAVDQSVYFTCGLKFTEFVPHRADNK
jgi:hypothetical protein